MIESLNVTVLQVLIERPARMMWEHDGQCGSGRRTYLFGQCFRCLAVDEQDARDEAKLEADAEADAKKDDEFDPAGTLKDEQEQAALACGTSVSDIAAVATPEEISF